MYYITTILKKDTVQSKLNTKNTVIFKAINQHITSTFVDVQVAGS